MVDFKKLLEARKKSGPEWSTFQRDVFEDIAKGAGNTVVRARAGSGKTTTLIEGVRYLDGDASALLCAFNTKTTDELRRRVPKAVDCDVRSCHSLGFAAVRKALRHVVLDKDKGRTIAQRVEEENPLLGRFSGRLQKLVGLAKNTLATSDATIQGLCIQHNLDDDEIPAPMMAGLALQCLAIARGELGTIDFDDQIWLPPTLNLKPDRYDFVLGDEVQDWNACQLWIVLHSVEKDGRVVAVGDDRQAIYGFRGADEDAMRKLIWELEAKVLPLSVTYRCARAIVRLANTVVPDLEAAPDAPEGLVQHVPAGIIHHPTSGARPGDVVLSRTNAPLMRACLGFLKMGVPAAVAGKEIGAGLVRLARRSKAHRVPQLLGWLAQYRETERARLEALGQEQLFEEVSDRCEALSVIAEGLHLVDEVEDRIGILFSDEDDASRVICSSTHRAKGLEWNRVFLLHDTFLRRSKRPRPDGAPPRPSRAEQNLYYVGVTRARRELYCAGESAPAVVSAPPQPLPPALFPTQPGLLYEPRPEFVPDDDVPW